MNLRKKKTLRRRCATVRIVVSAAFVPKSPAIPKVVMNDPLGLFAMHATGIKMVEPLKYVKGHSATNDRNTDFVHHAIANE